MDEILFESRSRIKQDRLNRFVILLKDYFDDKFDENTKLENLTSEEFSDNFEEVLLSVLKTNSEEKLFHFRNLLLNQILYSDKRNNDLFSLFVGITHSLLDDQIIILEKFADIKTEFGNAFLERGTLKSKKVSIDSDLDRLKQMNSNEIEIVKLQKEYGEIKKKFERAEKGFDRIKESMNPEIYGLSFTRFMILIQDLTGKGLLYDVGSTAIGVSQFEYMEISELGYSYINYIKFT